MFTVGDHIFSPCSPSPGSTRHWYDFPCDDWNRKRIRLNSEAFHQVAHPGIMVSPETTEAEEESDDEEALSTLDELIEEKTLVENNKPLVDI